MADAKPGLQAVKYVGHKEAVQVPTEGPTYKFPRDTAVLIPASVAGGLLKQPEKFKAATAEEAASAQRAKEAAPVTKPASGSKTVPGGK